MSARPVTPIGLIAQSLDRIQTRLADASVDADLRAELERACALAGGLERYVASYTTPASSDLEDLQRRTSEHDWGEASPLEAEMLSGHAEGRLLDFLVRCIGARRVLDIGMFTGYSALAMAQALAPGGEVIALEVDDVAADLAREGFARSRSGGRISVRMGPASASLAALAEVAQPFDLIFLDADKPGYLGYLEQVLDGELLSPQGLLCADNTLMQGEPWASGEPGANGRAIADFNAAVAVDARVEQVLVPMRDGLTLIRLAA